MNHTSVIVAGGSYGRTVAETWNPWRALRGMEHVTLARTALPPGAGDAVLAVWPDNDAVIVIDPALGRRQRNEALAHELLHLERLGGAESEVQQEVARRLVPIGSLSEFVRRRVGSELVVTALDVADEFDCTEALAELALRLLGTQGGHTP